MLQHLILLLLQLLNLYRLSLFVCAQSARIAHSVRIWGVACRTCQVFGQRTLLVQIQKLRLFVDLAVIILGILLSLHIIHLVLLGVDIHARITNRFFEIAICPRLLYLPLHLMRRWWITWTNYLAHLLTTLFLAGKFEILVVGIHPDRLLWLVLLHSESAPEIDVHSVHGLQELRHLDHLIWRRCSRCASLHVLQPLRLGKIRAHLILVVPSVAVPLRLSTRLLLHIIQGAGKLRPIFDT